MQAMANGDRSGFVPAANPGCGHDGRVWTDS